jgi:methionyl-tRNA formyltransferase
MKIKFFGNRRFVLEEILKRTPNVDINVIGGTHLERDSFLSGQTYRIVSNKQDVINELCKDDFDIMISNGLPYILNLQDLPSKPYVNIHPSFLPDLRGVDPVLGSILFKRDAGATCHLIDSGIDTGPIISRIKIPYSEDLTASLLYQLSFHAEKMCFIDAWSRNFIPLGIRPVLDSTLYFTRKTDTRLISFADNDASIIQTVKAFDNKNQGARFFIGTEEVISHTAWLSKNPFLEKVFPNVENNQVVLAFEDTIAIKRKDSFLFFSKIAATSEHWVGQIAVGK